MIVRRPAGISTRARAASGGRIVLVAAALMLAAGGGPVQATWDLPPLFIIQYQIVDSSPHADGVDYVVRARLLNLGREIPGAVARLTGHSPAATILDDRVSFGPLKPLRSGWSLDTFAIRRHGRWFDVFAALRWEISVAGVNQPPIASAGPDVTARVFDLVALDGSGSTDPDGDPLTYAWSWEERPAGSTAALSDAAGVRPEFAIDLPGRYVLALVVHDGMSASAPDLVEITTENSPPVADAGADRTVPLHSVVQLDGSGSSDVDGDPLTFEWVLTTRPAGSTAALDDPGAVRPSFEVDVPGGYAARLTVHDGAAASQPDTVVVRTDNSPPVADAGPDQTVGVGQRVTLDGSGSTDVDGDPLTYAWSLIQRPAGSAATLGNDTAVSADFGADVPGTYVVQLIVDDGLAESAPDTVTITTANSRPVADAGPDQTVGVSQTVVLDGGGSSDPDGDPLTFQWALTAKPAGSTAAIADPGAAVATFLADAPGDYTVQLIVSDGQTDSAPDTALISSTGSAPTADAGPDRLGVPVGTSVTLDGSGSSDPDGSPLTYAWSLLSRPSGSSATLSGAGTISPAFTPDVAGDYVAQLIVNDGFVDSAPDTVRVEAVDVPDVVVTVAATDDDASEIGPDPGVFTISRTGPTTGPLDVQFILQGGAVNGEDYAEIPAEATIPAGSDQMTITILPVDDGLEEGMETVILSLQAAPGYVVGTPGLDGVFIADSSVPTVTVTASVPEATEAGPQNGAFTISRTGATDESLVVVIARGGTANDGADYVNFGLILTIPAGESTLVVPVVPVADNVAEGPETVIMTISAGTEYIVGGAGSATVTIVDDPPVVSITAVDPDAAELLSDPGAVVISRSGGLLSAALDVDLQYGGTAGTSDYVALLSRQTIPAGETSRQVVITPRADNLVEGPEAVVVSIVTRSWYVTGAPSSATVTIADDPPVVSVVATDPDASESGPDTGTFTFSRSGGNLAASLLVFFTRGGTATSGADYVSIGGGTATTTIPASQSSGVVTITPIADAVAEPAETVDVALVPRSEYAIGTPGAATVFIQDAPP